MKLNKYSEHLIAFRQKGIYPQGEVKNALADIYEEMFPDNKNWGVRTINRGCGSCIGDMMKSLCAKFEEGLKKHKFPLKAALESKTIDINLDKITEINEELGLYPSDKVESPSEVVDKWLNPDKMKWGELRKYASSKGIDIKGKKKADILKELRNG